MTVVKSKASGIMLKESIVFLKSNIAELILNPVCEGNVINCKKQGKHYNSINRLSELITNDNNPYGCLTYDDCMVG